MSDRIQVGTFLKRNLFLPPDAAVPNAESEKEEDETNIQAQTAAEESSVKVLLTFNHLAQTTMITVSHSLLLLPPAFLSHRCLGASKSTLSTLM